MRDELLVLRSASLMNTGFPMLHQNWSVGSQTRNFVYFAWATKAATLLGDFVKELTTKVVAAHVLLEKTPEDTI